MLNSQQPVPLGLDHVQKLAVLGDRHPVGAFHILRLLLDRPVRREVEDLAVDRAARMSRGGEVNAAVAVRGEVVRTHELVPGLVLGIRGERSAIGGYAADAVAVVAGGEELALRRRDDGGRPAALLRPEDLVLVAVPGGHGIAVVFHVIQFAVIPDRAFRKVRVGIDDLDAAGVGRASGGGRRRQDKSRYIHVHRKSPLMPLRSRRPGSDPRPRFFRPTRNARPPRIRSAPETTARGARKRHRPHDHGRRSRS